MGMVTNSPMEKSLMFKGPYCPSYTFPKSAKTRVCSFHMPMSCENKKYSSTLNTKEDTNKHLYLPHIIFEILTLIFSKSSVDTESINRMYVIKVGTKKKRVRTTSPSRHYTSSSMFFFAIVC